MGSPVYQHKHIIVTIVAAIIIIFGSSFIHTFVIGLVLDLVFILAIVLKATLSSPRAESATAVTDRRCLHIGEGEDFLTGQLNFFTKTAVTPEQKVEKSIPRWEINRHAEG